jgi:cysteine desulfurase/selenocysteine lyase
MTFGSLVRYHSELCGFVCGIRQNPFSPPRRLYLDNAATSFPKPKQVWNAMAGYASDLGASAGRGAYREAVQTGALLTECRRRLNKLFHGESSDHFIFTLNCTDALNLAIKGLFPSGKKGHAICTEIDHNSILRPLNALVGSSAAIEQTRVASIHQRTGRSRRQSPGRFARIPV